MGVNNKPLTDIQIKKIIEQLLNIFDTVENIQKYWKTHSSKEIEIFSRENFDISYYLLRKIILEHLQLEDRTPQDSRLLKQNAWKTRPHYTEEQKLQMNTNRKKTCLEKYGVDNVSKVPEVIQKIKDTTLLKYGVTNINSLESNKQAKSLRMSQLTKEQKDAVIEKRKKTCLEKYGVENIYSCSDIIDKIKYIKQRRYGDPYYSNREKAKNTCLKLYGVKHFSQSYDWINSTKFKRYVVGDTYLDSLPELAVYLYCLQNDIEISRSPIRFRYSFNDSEHYCYPDFSISGSLIEIKGDYLYSKMKIPGTIDNAKLNCLLEHNVKIWDSARYNFYIEWFNTNGYKKEDFKVKR